MQKKKIFYPRAPQQLLRQFMRFGVIGAMGLVWDILLVTVLRPYIGLTAATLLSYFAVASLNWLLNQLWTFRNVAHRDHPILQWLRFLAANSFGFLLNRGTVYTLCFTVPFCAQHVALPLAAGSLMGLLANFNLSRKLVFRAKVPETPLELAKMTVDLNVDPTDKDLES
ncbi:GtrA family protein [Asaia prunellae]|uniref:GtrA family protein n=1 Tax=Asaia prunellae TaxID=610245 RepID=UPI00047099C6|nr:GtrA family protein [Asaia prunellae]